MNLKSRSAIAITAVFSSLAILFSACTTQQRATRTRYQQQATPGTLGSNVTNNATGNTGMRLRVNPGTVRTVTGTRVGTGAGSRLGYGTNVGTGTVGTGTMGAGTMGAGTGNMLRYGTNVGIGTTNVTAPTPVPAPAPATATTSDRSKAASIKRGLEATPGISNVNVVVMGNTAIVSYGRKNGATNPAATDRTVANKVKQIDRTITNVYTSSSKNIGTQVTRLSNDMTNNRPMNEIRASFNKIINTINPAARVRS